MTTTDAFTLTHFDWRNEVRTTTHTTLEDVREHLKYSSKLGWSKAEQVIRSGSALLDDDSWELAGPGIPKPVRFGDRKECYWIEPRTLPGGQINHGWAYSNADTLERALERAEELLAGDYMGIQVGYVDVRGDLVEFRGDGWHPIRGIYSNRIARTRPVKLTAQDLEMECRFFEVADRFLHQRRSDGSCRCGENLSLFSPSRVTA